jgi:biotin operon repressor
VVWDDPLSLESPKDSVRRQVKIANRYLRQIGFEIRSPNRRGYKLVELPKKTRK